MNPILMCCYNNLSLTKQAVDSALMQDVEGGVDLVVVNNGSTDGTGQWFSDLGAIVPRVTVLHMTHNESPCKVANALLQTLFVNSPYVLAIPNDVILPPSTYREFLRWPRGLVTGSEIRDRTAYDAHIQALQREHSNGRDVGETLGIRGSSCEGWVLLRRAVCSLCI